MGFINDILPTVLAFTLLLSLAITDTAPTVSRLKLAEALLGPIQCRGLDSVVIPDIQDCAKFIICCDGVGYPRVCKDCPSTRPTCEYGK